MTTKAAADTAVGPISGRVLSLSQNLPDGPFLTSLVTAAERREAQDESKGETKGGSFIFYTGSDFFIAPQDAIS